MSGELLLGYSTVLTIGLTLMGAVATGADDGDLPGTFRIWATSCAHVPADIRRGRESLAKVIRQSEGREEGAPAFAWDIMIDAGDLSAHQKPPGDRDGMELIRQYRALTKHRREQIYNVPGNHDAPYYDHGPGSWFAKWGDPLGQHTEFSGVDPMRRPFPVEGSWERYRFEAGNILFLMLADRNDAPEPVGRGHSKDGKSGGYPAGAVTRETFEWWKKQVIDNQDKIIVTMHHHVLRDTTTASGFGEGNPTYHGSSGGPEGSSYLYYLIEKDDPDDFQFTKDAHVFEDFLDQFEKENGRGAIDFWVGGHTHVKGPDDDFGEKTITETKWGVTFLQAAALTVHHGGSHPLSRLVTLIDGSDEALVETYLHEKNYKKEPVGFYEPAARAIPLRHCFAAPPPIELLPPFPESARVFDEPYVNPETGTGTEHTSHQARPSLDLTGLWNSEDGGSFELETQVKSDTGNLISSKPALEADGEVDALLFDGSQRLWVGPVEMEDWTDLTVSIWIQTTHNDPGMRVVCKDHIGEPGCFMLHQPNPGVWLMQAWDDRAAKWQTATWRSDVPSDGQWHHLVGMVNSRTKKVTLLVDGEQKAEAPWTAETLDDSDETDLVVGADSGRKKFGQTFRGKLRDLRIVSRALNADEVRELTKGK